MSGWNVVTIPGDGDCLFAAIADQLYGDQGRQAEVRQIAFDEITRNQDTYKDSFVTEVSPETIANIAAATAAIDAARGADAITAAYRNYFETLRNARDQETIAGHLENVRSRGYWGSQVDIVAIMNATGVPIELYERDASGGYTYVRGGAEAGKSKNPIRLLWNGSNHYDSLRDPAITYPILGPMDLIGAAAATPTGTPGDDDLALAASLLLTSSALALSGPAGPTILGKFSADVQKKDSLLHASIFGKDGLVRAAGATVFGKDGLVRSAASGLLKAVTKKAPVATETPEQRSARRAERERLDAARANMVITDPILLSENMRDIKYLLERRKEPKATESVKNVDDPAKPGDIVGVYVMWGDKLLIHRRSPAVADDSKGTIYVPTGPVNQGDTSFQAAALRILKATANMAKDLSENDLVFFKRTKDGDKTSMFYYTTYAYKPEVLGQPTDPNVDMDFTFVVSDPSDSKMNIVFKGEPAEPAKGQFWATLAPLRVMLTAPKLASYNNKMIDDNLRDLAFKLRIKTGSEALDLRKLPGWSTGSFNPDKIPEACKTTSMRTGDCLDKTVRDDIYTADDYARDGRLVKRVDDPHLIEYRRLVDEKDQANVNKADQIQKKIDRMYHSHFVHIRDPKTRLIRRRIVPNPYVALSYREEEATTFATPGGVSKYDKPYGTMKKQNFQLLQELVPKQIIADKAMAVAILESLWYCGQNPMVSDDPRCFPLRLLGELKEYQADKIQRSQAVEAKAIIEHSEWPALKLMLIYLKQAVAGAKPYSFNDELLKPITAKVLPPMPTKSGSAWLPQTQPIMQQVPGAPLKPTTQPTAAAGAQALLKPTDVLVKPTAQPPILAARPTAPAPLQTGVRIVPRQLGNIAILPVLPGRPLGTLPPFVRT